MYLHVYICSGVNINSSIRELTYFFQSLSIKEWRRKAAVLIPNSWRSTFGQSEYWKQDLVESRIVTLGLGKRGDNWGGARGMQNSKNGTPERERGRILDLWLFYL